MWLLFCFLLDLQLKYLLYLNQLHASEYRHPSIAVYFTSLGYEDGCESVLSLT